MYLVKICWSMVHAKNVPGRFWAEVIKMAAYVINLLPKPKLGLISPYKKLWNVNPTISHFRVFGCVCYVFVPSYLRSKFNKKVVHCIFVGYDRQRKRWRYCDLPSGWCYTIQNLVFYETSLW